jgi:hypothetical protein
MVAYGRIAGARTDPGTEPELAGLLDGVWGAFWGFQVMGLFEWNFGDVEVTIGLVFLIGAALAGCRPGRGRGRRRRQRGVAVTTNRVLGATLAALLLAPAVVRGAECETIGEVPAAAQGPRPPSNVAFGPGEKLTFSVQYGLISAGEAILEIDPNIKIRSERPTYHIVSQAASNSTFSTVFRVRDRVESYMDTLDLHSVRFEKHLREGNYKKDLWIEFDHARRKAVIDGQRECDVQPHVQDVLSSLYYVRTLKLEPGKSIYVPNHDNGKNYPLEIRVEARERVTVDAGTFDCLILEPVLMGEAVFKQNGRLKVWVTDDELHMPVLLKSKVFVGAIAGVLTKFELGGRFRDARPPAMVATR